jgi:predicted amidophosphoribosyltransferase
MPCLGCKQELPDWRTGSRLCPDCTEEGYENLACRLDSRYDRTALNDWERFVEAVARWYGLINGSWRS